ncbi:hypothetical protein ACKC5O_20855, partial [Aeromonas schubertii]|uniref:hypothetical protein n=1 Tax=Aeromonas schubertii TaxID=652 RepID=UPI0038B42467
QYQHGGPGNMSTDDPDLVNYRGKINREEWREFKNNVPRTTRLEDKLNEMIREFNRNQREEDD